MTTNVSITCRLLIKWIFFDDSGALCSTVQCMAWSECYTSLCSWSAIHIASKVMPHFFSPYFLRLYFRSDGNWRKDHTVFNLHTTLFFFASSKVWLDCMLLTWILAQRFWATRKIVSDIVRLSRSAGITTNRRYSDWIPSTAFKVQTCAIIYVH